METTIVTPTVRLTGSQLIRQQKKLEAAGYSRDNAIIACGYQMPDGSPAYTQFYTEKLRALDYLNRKKVQAHAVENRRYHSMIDAIKNCRHYSVGIYRVVPYSTTGGSVYYGRTILLTFSFTEAEVTVFNCKPTRPIKERINRILMELCGLKLFRKGESWSVVYPYAPAARYETGARFDII